MSRCRALAAALAFSLLPGCGSRPVPEPAPAPEQASTVTERWSTAGAQALRLAESGRYGEADSVLAAFATRHPGTTEAADALYWRALLRLDPANPTGGPRDAVVAIDAYLAGGTSLPRYE